jgi:hypothetical protein
LYFSPVHAGSYAQRPHFMVRAWLEWGVKSVLWVNPYPCRLPRWRDVRRIGGCAEQGTRLDPRVRVLNVPALPIEPLPLGPWLNRQLLGRGAWREIERFASGGSLIVGIGRPCAVALAALRRLHPVASFFDAMDDFPEFHRGLSRRSVRGYEDAVAAEVDLVVASSTFLADKFTRRGLRVEKVLNGCEETDRGEEGEKGRGEDWETKQPLLSKSPPLQVSPSASLTAPILGYLGCIGHWFDWPLVIRLAETMPWARIELVGPCAVGPPSRLPENVTLLPACKQSEASKHLSRFSAGLIPFSSNALTAGVDPIKYYDYRAAGLQVLSTRFGEMALRGGDDGVHFLDQAGGLAEAVSAALVHRCDSTETSRFRRNNNWTSRFRRSDGLRSLLPTSRIRRAA